jgi:transposase
VEAHKAFLKKKRDEDRFRQAQVELAALHEKADAGECVLAYLDEAGFSQTHPNRSAWTPPGERHLIEAKRGKRLNVMGALLSTGELFCSKYWQNTTADVFAGFLGLLYLQVDKPLTIILDNASIHKAKAIMPMLEVLKAKGVTLYFLPPYSPELNRIEMLWHKMKHRWMAVKCRDQATLEADVDEITSQFGEKYKLAFLA